MDNPSYYMEPGSGGPDHPEYVPVSDAALQGAASAAQGPAYSDEDATYNLYEGTDYAQAGEWGQQQPGYGMQAPAQQLVPPPQEARVSGVRTGAFAKILAFQELGYTPEEIVAEGYSKTQIADAGKNQQKNERNKNRENRENKVRSRKKTGPYAAIRALQEKGYTPEAIVAAGYSITQQNMALHNENKRSEAQTKLKAPHRHGSLTAEEKERKTKARRTTRAITIAGEDTPHYESFKKSKANPNHLSSIKHCYSLMQDYCKKHRLHEFPLCDTDNETVKTLRVHSNTEDEATQLPWTDRQQHDRFLALNRYRDFVRQDTEFTKLRKLYNLPENATYTV
jgi:hypothetical protein